jgi:hypothetical protein
VPGLQSKLQQEAKSCSSGTCHTAFVQVAATGAFRIPTPSLLLTTASTRPAIRIHRQGSLFSRLKILICCRLIGCRRRSQAKPTIHPCDDLLIACLQATKISRRFGVWRRQTARFTVSILLGLRFLVQIAHDYVLTYLPTCLKTGHM